MSEEQQLISDVDGKSLAFVIEGWSVEPATLRLQKGDEQIKLEPKVMAVLEYLASRPGEVVNRQALEEAIWTDVVVGYDALSNTIIKLRKAFGDNARNPKIIETISKTGVPTHRRGYAGRDRRISGYIE